MAVFTPVADADARAFLKRYDVGALQELRGVAEGVENTNYFLRAGGAAFVLTLFERRTPEDALPYCLGLTAHLADRGFPAPRPIPQRDGALFGRLNGRPAALIEWLPGAWSRAPSPADAAQAGAALARLHDASADFPLTLANRVGPDEWRRLVDVARAARHNADAADTARQIDELDREVEALTARWPTAELPRGPIHADYFPDNVLFDGDTIGGVIDFYFACTDARAYDLAIALNAWGFDADGAFQTRLARAFTGAYAAVRPLTPAERAAFPILCRGAAARFTLTRLHDMLHHDPAWTVTPKDPAPFARRLQTHRRVTDPAFYGLD